QLACVNDVGQTECSEHSDVDPADVELVPLRAERGRLRIRVMVVVQLFADDPQTERNDVTARVLGVEVTVADRVTDTVDHMAEIRNPNRHAAPHHETDRGSE